MSKFLLMIASLLLSIAASTSAEEIQSHDLEMQVSGVEAKFDVSVPRGWSRSPQTSRNSRTFVNTGADETKNPTAQVRIFLEPRLDHDDALEQLRQLSALVEAKDERFLEIGGWPAFQFSAIEEQPNPDNAPELEHKKLLRIQTYVAAGDALINIAGSIPANAPAGEIHELRNITTSLAFRDRGNPTQVKRELEALRNAEDSLEKLNAAPTADAAPEPILLDTKPVILSPEEGADDRIDTGGFGELEIATSPDGQDVVVALQSRFWVSSNDGGATFPNSGRVGVGNGDPSVAWGQSGKFYMAWIDNSGSCNTNYRDPVVAPDLDSDGNPDPAPNGLDCTGIARSDDNGATFQTNTVNPAVVCIGRAPAGSPNNAGECFPDQEHIAADRWNAGDTADDDQVYSTWRNFKPGSQDAALVCSSDSGVTWSAPFDIGSPEVFPRITVGPDGFVYVATYNGTGYRLYKFTSCVNGLNPVPGFPVTVGARNPYRCPFAGHDRCDQNPTSQTVVVDGTDPNHVYYAYVADREAAGTDTGFSDIIVRDSLDGGQTWNIVGRIARANENVDARRIMPWLCTTGGAAVVTWFEQRGPQPTDSTDYFGAHVGLDPSGNLVPKQEFILSDVPDNWCDTGWRQPTRWGFTSTQLSNAAEACPNQPQLAGQCGDGINGTPDSGTRCDFSADDGTTFTNCLPAASSPSGNNEQCLTGGGVPKYGDYNGNACAGGKLFAAWASANVPDGLAAPDTPTNPGVLFEVVNLDNLGVPVITVPGSVQFGDVCPASGTQRQVLKICNTGSANLQVDRIDSDNPDFAVTVPTSGYPVTISPDFCFEFDVTYTPGDEPTIATLTVPSDDPDRPTIDVSAEANLGAAAIDTFMADSGNFGEVCSASFSDKNLTIQNNGSCDLQIDAIALSGADAADFELPDGSFTGTMIEPGNSLLVPVRFAPDNFTDPNPRTAGVDVQSSTVGGDSLTEQNTSVQGTVPPPDINVAIANSGDFGAVCKGQTADLDLTLFNQGRCDLSIDSIVSDNPLFVLPADTTYPLVLSHDADFTLPVRFAPEACNDAGETGTITINSDDPDEDPVEIGVSATSPCPNLVIDPAPLSGGFAFPPTVVDTEGTLGCYSDQITNLRNTGACPLTISDIVATGDDYAVMQPTSFPIVLPPGEETLGVTVRFTPLSGGAPDAPDETLGLLTVSSDDPDASGQADLCGEGVVQSGIRTLVTDVTLGTPLIVDSVDSMTVKSSGKNRPSPINLRFTDLAPSSTTVCGNPVSWHLNLEQLPAAETTGSNGGKSEYEVKAKEGNLQDNRSFPLGQCEFKVFQMQLQSSDGDDGGACLLLAKGEACTLDSECCSGKCRGPEGGKSCK
ncbi:MAG: choice-of-anchor D domain-containing protein [Candidatus Wenzhouxiangella sp. M2_3B_020]